MANRDEVLLQETQVKPGSSRVLTKQRYFGPYVIKTVYSSGPSRCWKGLPVSTGKTLRNLVTNDRLKRYDTERQRFEARLPKIQTTQQLPSVDQSRNSSDDAKPVELLSEHVIRGKKEYRVKYTDGKSYLCDWVNKLSLIHI